MQTNSPSDTLVGTDGGPPSAQAYKRAVYMQAPPHFTVEVLPPQKHGNNYSYGMRIFPLRNEADRRSTVSGTSSNSSSSQGAEYDVWRRWEDCLYFQDILESQYALMSREKRARLIAGKGVKKNGVYIGGHDDPNHLRRAASFESLPPGPDPNMIAKDVHEFLPRLTKKGTLFRASTATVEQRASEFRVLIDALLCDGDDVPMLIRDLRSLRVVRDFFGFWRRDHDRVEKEQRDAERGSRTESIYSGTTGTVGTRSSTVRAQTSPRNSSVFGGGFGMYFSASNLSLQIPNSHSVPSDQVPESTTSRRLPPLRSKSLSRKEHKERERTSSSSANVRSGAGAASGAGAPIPQLQPQSQRQRAQTMQSMSSASTKASSSRARGSISTTSATSASSSLMPATPASAYYESTSAMRPPASAPAGSAFRFARQPPAAATNVLGSSDEGHEYDGYLSDMQSAESVAAATAQDYLQADYRQQPPRTPRSAPPYIMRSDASPSAGVATEAGRTGRGKGKRRADAEQVIVSLGDTDSAFDIPFVVDAGIGPMDVSDGLSIIEGMGLEDRYSHDFDQDSNLNVDLDDDDVGLVLRTHEHLIPASHALDTLPEFEGESGQAEAGEAWTAGDERGDSVGSSISDGAVPEDAPLDVGMDEFEFGDGVHMRLQDLTIEEEEDEHLGHDPAFSRSPVSTPIPNLGNKRKLESRDDTQIFPTEQEPGHSFRLAPPPAAGGTAGARPHTADAARTNRSWRMFTSPYLAAYDGDEVSVLEDGASEGMANTAQFAGANANGLRALYPAPTQGTSAEHVHEVNGRSSGADRPVSVMTQSTISSGIDIDRRLSTSSIVLHTPLFNDMGERPATPNNDSDGTSMANAIEYFSDDHSHECDHDQPSSALDASAYGPRGSVSSISSFMTDCSADAIIPRRAMSPPPATVSSRALSSSLRRSLSASSRRTNFHRASKISVPGDVTWADEEDELLDSYFHGVTSAPFAISQSEETPLAAALSPGREQCRPALAHPDYLPKPFQNRPPGQFHLPWTPPLVSTQIIGRQMAQKQLQQQRQQQQQQHQQHQQHHHPYSPPPSAPAGFGFGFGRRDSVTSLESVQPPPSAASMSTTFSSMSTEDLTLGSATAGDPSAAVAIKAALGDAIVKFRAPRTIHLVDVRAKLLDKFVQQQGVPLSSDFALAYQPAATAGGRLAALRQAGRTRSNSVGVTEANQLRYIFSQKEWQDALASCGPKLTLHILNNTS